MKVKKDNKSKENKKIKIQKKRGNALAETVLLTAIAIVILLALFYPQIVSMFKNAIANIGVWFDSAISTIGVIK